MTKNISLTLLLALTGTILFTAAASAHVVPKRIYHEMHPDNKENLQEGGYGLFNVFDTKKSKKHEHKLNKKAVEPAPSQQSDADKPAQ